MTNTFQIRVTRKEFLQLPLEIRRRALAEHAQAPLARATGSVEYRDLRDGDRILEVDEFWDDSLRQFIQIHKCASVSARWMVRSPYSSNFYVRARRPMTPSPNDQEEPRR